MIDLEKEKRDTIAKLEAMGRLRDPEIKKVMLKVKREQFVLPQYKDEAWTDTPLPIVGRATISAPHMYAITLEAVKLRKGERVLEVGSGSGYGAALIRELVGSGGLVVTVEIISEVYEFAKKNLKKASCSDVKVILSDGSMGCEKYAPYDCIIVTAACPEIPRPLIKQLKVGGRLVAPVGGLSMGQDLIYLEKTDGIKTKNLGGVIFLPLTGRHGYKV